MNISTSDASVAEGDSSTTTPNRPAAIARRPTAGQFRARPALARADREPAAIEPAAIIRAVIK
jgi:hypothetical protein